MANPRFSRTQIEATPDPIRTAFRELHGRHLHGFALLVTLGDRALAARLAADAIAAAAGRSDELRHPERAAAWLRARVVSSLPRRVRAPSSAEQRVSLEPLAVDEVMLDGLATLTVRERAALVAADIERLDPRDVEVIAGQSPARLERMLVRARRRYGDACAAATAAGAPSMHDGPLVAHVHAVARRALT